MAPSPRHRAQACRPQRAPPGIHPRSGSGARRALWEPAGESDLAGGDLEMTLAATWGRGPPAGPAVSLDRAEQSSWRWVGEEEAKVFRQRRVSASVSLWPFLFPLAGVDERLPH